MTSYPPLPFRLGGNSQAVATDTSFPSHTTPYQHTRGLIYTQRNHPDHWATPRTVDMQTHWIWMFFRSPASLVLTVGPCCWSRWGQMAQANHVSSVSFSPPRRSTGAKHRSPQNSTSSLGTFFLLSLWLCHVSPLWLNYLKMNSLFKKKKNRKPGKIFWGGKFLLLVYGMHLP